MATVNVHYKHKNKKEELRQHDYSGPAHHNGCFHIHLRTSTSTSMPQPQPTSMLCCIPVAERANDYPDNSVTSHLFSSGRRPDTAFQRYRNSRLGGEFHSEITGRSLSECLDECLRQTSFQCRCVFAVAILVLILFQKMPQVS